jgi:tetratricopeptide (TPR) repeat protein
VRDAGVVPAELLNRLRDDLAHRRIESGMARLEACQRLLETLDPAWENAARLVGYVAQWADAGFASPVPVTHLLARFPKAGRAALPLADYVHLRMAEGFAAMDEEEYAAAIRHFEFVLSVADEIRDGETVAIANFWIGRSLRNQGRYDDALSYTVRAREMALELGCEKMAAVMQSLESWLLFQKGKLREAASILEKAEAVLAGSDDYVLRGNIQSAYGRIARREGRYDEAVRRFGAAIAEYQKRDPRHRNLARSLVNVAFTKRLVALRLHRKVDREAARRDRTGAVSPQFAEERAQCERLRAEAFAELAQADGIYRGGHPRHHGEGSVHLNFGYLHLDSGELDRAGAEAAAGWQRGVEKKDYILMARARILECMVERAKVEEEIGETSRHAQLAYESARDAVEYARHTQNRRLLVRAYTWPGLALADHFFGNNEAARASLEAAEGLLKSESHDYVWDDLQALKTRVQRSGTIDARLREWSQGLAGGRTLQQISEEVAALIIPKVWEREGRKVSRVAAQLSVSPKKVRRILARAGLLGGSAPSR